MSEMDGVIGCADLRPFVRVEKVGHKPEHTLLALGGYGAATRARHSSHAIYRGRRKRRDVDGGRIHCHGGGRTGDKSVWTGIGIEIIEINRDAARRTRWDWGHGRCGHIFSGGKEERTIFLSRRGRRSGKGI